MKAVTRLLPSGCPEREPAPTLGWQLLAMLVSLGLQGCPSSLTSLETWRYMCVSLSFLPS